MPNLRSLGFSPRIIIVWYFIHRSMVHFKLIFVYNARYRLKGLIHCKIRIIIFFQRHCWKDYPFAIEFSLHFCWNCSWMGGVIFGPQILLYWSICLSLCQFHTTLVTVFLSWNQVILDLQTCHCLADWLVSSRSLAFAHEF